MASNLLPVRAGLAVDHDEIGVVQGAGVRKCELLGVSAGGGNDCGEHSPAVAQRALGHQQGSSARETYGGSSISGIASWSARPWFRSDSARVRNPLPNVSKMILESSTLAIVVPRRLTVWLGVGCTPVNWPAGCLVVVPAGFVASSLEHAYNMSAAAPM